MNREQIIQMAREAGAYSPDKYDWEFDTSDLERFAKLVAEHERKQAQQAEQDWSMLEATQESLREHMARIKELESQLAQQAEPVAWYDEKGVITPNPLKFSKPLYTSPPTRQPMTEEQERKAFLDWCFSVGLMAESHGLRSESSDCDTAWKAWQARAAHGIKGEA